MEPQEAGAMQETDMVVGLDIIKCIVHTCDRDSLSLVPRPLFPQLRTDYITAAVGIRVWVRD